MSDVSKNEWDDRRLCPDGACVGVVGPDGKCKVCGTRDEGAEARPVTERLTALEIAEQEAEAAAALLAREAAEAEDAFDPDRKLCPDGACIGVLGADGRCKVCGQRA